MIARWVLPRLVFGNSSSGSGRISAGRKPHSRIVLLRIAMTRRYSASSSSSGNDGVNVTTSCSDSSPAPRVGNAATNEGLTPSSASRVVSSSWLK
ncbi:Uncharacterised protein [Burkholderia pseudomallei]|nr:Uncharacterised protein [Burkholderia pseudomallei]